MKVAIVGAGPAGLMCAWRLSVSGHEVYVYESKTNLGAQGSGVLLQPVCIQLLDMLGLRDRCEALGQKIVQIRGTMVPLDRTTVAIDYRSQRECGYALGMHRLALWQVLQDESERAGAQLFSDSRITNIVAANNDQYRLIGANNQPIHDAAFDLIVDASGAHSKLRDHAILPSSTMTLSFGSLWSTLKLASDSIYAPSEMILNTERDNSGIGILPIGKTEHGGDELATLFFNLVWKESPDWTGDTFRKWKDSMYVKWPQITEFLDQITEPEQLYLAKFNQHTLSKPYGKGIAFIGDAAHSSSPQLGQGINMSLLDAVSLDWAMNKETELEKALQLYGAKRRTHVMIYQTLARTLAPFYQSDNKLAIATRDLFYPVLSKLLYLRRANTYLIAGQVGRPLRHLDMNNE